MSENSEKLSCLTNFFIQLAANKEVSDRVMCKILCALNDYGIPVPRTTKTLLKKSISVEKAIPIAGGKLILIGIEANLSRLNYEFFNQSNTITIDISWDGVALYGASAKELWPITGSFVNKRVSPFLIACFIGNSKPKNPGEFFYPVLEEIKKLRIEGVLVGKEKSYKKFKLRLTKGDTPARHWAKGTLAHGGYEACECCDSVGSRIENSMVYSEVIGNLRTNESFRERRDGRHNKYDSIFTNYEFFDMIQHFPPDPMHLIDEGAGCAILNFLKQHLTSEKLELLNEKMRSVSKCIPSDMSRTTRDLNDLKFFKSTEFRTFLLYTGPYVLLDVVPKQLYEHFLMLHYSYRVLSGNSENHINDKLMEKAEKLIEIFVKNFKSFYGPTSLSFNIHMLLHICFFVKLYGPLNNFSCYENENWYQKLTKWVKKGVQIDAQIMNAWNASFFDGEKETNFNEFNITAKSPNNFILTRDWNLLEVKEVKKEETGTCYIGDVYDDFDNFYKNSFFASCDLNIYRVSKKKFTPNVKINQSFINCKVMSIVTPDEFVVLPILHYML